MTNQQPVGSSFAAFDGRLWIVGYNGTWSSVDGVTWTKNSDGFLDNQQEADEGTVLALGGKLWHLNEYTTRVRSSTDGTNWTVVGSRPDTATNYSSTIAFAGRIWLMGGAETFYKPVKDVWASEDGTHWTRMPAPPWPERSGFAAVVFEGKLWIMGGRGTDARPLNDIWCTADGVEWEKVKDPPMWSRRRAHTALTFDGKIWVLGGQASNYNSPVTHTSDAWYTENGLDWNVATGAAPWSPRAFHASVVFKNKMWVIGGTRFEYPGGGVFYEDLNNDVWSSPDGTNWRREVEHAPWSPRGEHVALVFHDRIWLMGGVDRNRYNDVWSSPDGVNWVVENASAPWTPRSGHAAVVFKDKLWLIGGRISGPQIALSDVWNSEDGRTWGRVLETGPWDYGIPRQKHACLVYDNKLWLVGGEHLMGFADVWYSENGLHWTRAVDYAPFGYRTDHAMVVFAERMWLLGGRLQTAGLGAVEVNRNDVWFSYTSDVPDFTPLPTPTPTGTPTPTPTPTPAPPSAFVLDDFGAVHTGGGANSVVRTGGPYFAGTSRAMALKWPAWALNAQHLGVYVLDGYGGVHTYSAARPPQNFYFMPDPGDVAVDLEVFQKDLAGVPGDVGYFVLDRFGKLWAGGLADPAVALSGGVNPPLNGATQYAVDLLLADAKGRSGWIMDNMGAVHPFGGAVDPAFPVSSQDNWVALAQVGDQLVRMDTTGALQWSGEPPDGWELSLVDGGLMIDLAVQEGYGLIGLDRFGALHATSGAILPPPGSGPPYFGFEAARDLELR
ncbi:hypothetical protein HS125_07805 [bacterium]|nr:hypothetical protein [bacterium]